MPHWTDKDTDKLFQQGLEHYDFEYNPAAWEQMGKLLDRDKRRRLLLWWLGIMGVLLVATAVFFLWDGEITKTGTVSPADNQEARQLPTLEQDIQEKEDNARAAQSSTENLTETSETGLDSGTTIQKTGLGETGKQESTPPLAQDQKKKRKIATQATPAARRKHSTGGASPGITLPPPVAESSNPEAREGGVLPVGKAEESSPQSGTLAAGDGPSRLGAEVALLPGLFPLPVLKPKLIYHTEPPPPIGSVSNSSKPDENKSHPMHGNSLVVSAVVSPELNSVGFGDFSRLNLKYGLHLEYRYRERFGLSFGANYLRMKYVAEKDEFQLPATFPNLDKLVATRGTCSMLEVPVNLFYYHNGASNSGLFGGFGMGSYFLFSEYYAYDYSFYGQNFVKDWSTDENGNYWWGIGSLSVGYNHWMSDRTAVRIMPYVQIPLRGVGRGNVKLYSVGISFRLDASLFK